MSTRMPKSGHRSFHTIRAAAWFLGFCEHEVCRAIRVGAIRAERRRGRLVVPTGQLMRLFDLRGSEVPNDHG